MRGGARPAPGRPCDASARRPDVRRTRPPIGLAVVATVVAAALRAPARVPRLARHRARHRTSSTSCATRTSANRCAARSCSPRRSPWARPRSAPRSAWLVTRTDLPGRRVWRIVVPLPLVIPSFVGAFTLIAAFAPGGLVETFFGFDSLPRIEGLLGRRARPHVAHVSRTCTCRSRRGSSRCRRRSRRVRVRSDSSPRQVFASIVLPQCTGRDVGGRPARLPVRAERVRCGATAPLRHAHPGDLLHVGCSTAMSRCR